MRNLSESTKTQLDCKNQHRVETYKSLISISTESFKYCALLNGGAAAGMLSGMAAITKLIGPSWFAASITLFVFGLSFCGLSMFLAWLTQLQLHNENIGSMREKTHETALRWAFFFLLLSLLCFSTGALVAAYHATWAAHHLAD